MQAKLTFFGKRRSGRIFPKHALCVHFGQNFEGIVLPGFGHKKACHFLQYVAGFVCLIYTIIFWQGT